MNEAVEDYLCTIYSLFEKAPDRGIRSVDIAKALGISRPSVSAMMRRLAKEGYIEADPYSKIFLTSEGKEHGRKVMHKHRVIEVFLTDVLGHGIEDIHDEAHRLEHAFSDASIQKLDVLLDNPTVSPTGKSIPHDSDGVKIMNTTLDDMKKGQSGRILKVSGKGEVHKRILDMGVVKGSKITVERIAPFGDPIEFRIKGYILSLRKEEAKNIEVALE
jgi:DtxR family transcriptional regulator, Mn-dependent transcriptional regulator